MDMQRIPFARTADTVWATGSGTQIFGLILRIRVKIYAEMNKILRIKPELRQLDPERLARITTGAIKSLCKRGFGLPIRPVRVDNRKAEWTLPSNVARELRVKAGDYIVRCRTDVEDELTIAEVSALDERDVDGLPILGEIVSVSKVRLDTDGLEITITKGAKTVYGEVVGRFVVCGLTIFPGVVTEKIVEHSQVLEEMAKMLTEGLWWWPDLIEDCTGAWLAGFEPFAEAMADLILPPLYATRDPRNLARVAAVNEVMIETADLQAELRCDNDYIRTRAEKPDRFN